MRIVCGRFVAATDPEDIIRLFLVDDRQAEDLRPSWNVAPTDPVYAVAAHEGRRVLVTLRWGLVPFWAKNPKVAARHINARAETVASKPTFAESFQRRRCLIPADGFYEWQRHPDGARTPYFIHRVDGTTMAFAGLWASWHDPTDGARLRSCAIVTTQASGGIATLHERMPVVLDPSTFSDWLDRDADPAHLHHLLASTDPETLTWRRVGTAVNSVRNNHSGLVTPVVI
ncbi:MAG: SOS response-associated peptidase [Egibacteraceae bacterium]